MTEPTAQVIDADPVDRPDIGDLDNGTTIAPVEVSTRKITVPIGQPIGDLDEAYRLAQALERGTLLPDALRGKPADILITILWGRELGLSAMQSVNGIYVTKGRPQLTGLLWNALVQAAGHAVDSVEGVDDRGLPTCETTLTRGDTGQSITVKWTIANAERARLCRVVDGQIRARSKADEPLPWEQYPEDMLFWRTLVRCCRRLAPEVAFGFGLHDPSPLVDEQGVEIVEAVPVAPPVAAQPLTPVDAESVAADVRATVAEFTQPTDGTRTEPPVDDAPVLPADEPPVPAAADPAVQDAEAEPDPTLGVPDDYVDPWTAAETPVAEPQNAGEPEGDGTPPLDEPEAPQTKRTKK